MLRNVDILPGRRKINHVIKKKRSEIRTEITSKNSATILEHHCNSHGYCTNWQENGENFVMPLDILSLGLW
jgi:hypothetical protein